MEKAHDGDESQEVDVFQIDDFTVITPLEVLISQLEMTIHDWGLGKGAKHNNFAVRKVSFLLFELSFSKFVTVNFHSFFYY